MKTNRWIKNTLTNVQTCIFSAFYRHISPVWVRALDPASVMSSYLTQWPLADAGLTLLSSELWHPAPSAAEAHLWPWDVGLTPDPDLLGTSHCWWRMRRNSRLRNICIYISTYSNSVLFTKNEIFTPLGILLKRSPAPRVRSGHPGWWCNTRNTMLCNP